MIETTHASTSTAPGRGTRDRRGSARPAGAAGRSRLPEPGAAAAAARSALDGALRDAWQRGFWAGAASVAPELVRRCAACAAPFVADHRREVYCGARCRNRVMKRRYRARLRARRSGRPEERRGRDCEDRQPESA